MTVVIAQHARRSSPEATATAVLTDLETRVNGDASFVLLPENAFLGADGSSPSGLLAESVMERLAALAKSRGTYVLTGSWTELVAGSVAQVTRLLNPAGDIQVELCRSVEPDGSTGTGTDFPVVETDYGKVGVLLGPDFWLVEPPRIQCLQGAELLLVAGSLNGRAEAVQRAAIWGIATLNTVAVAVASSLNANSNGGSAVAMPEGFLAEAGAQERVLSTPVDLDRIRHLREPDLRFQETLWFGLWARRPDLYSSITHGAPSTPAPALAHVGAPQRELSS